MDHWDKKLIEMLHNCEAGDKAVITSFTSHYEIINSVHNFKKADYASAMDYWNLYTNLPVFKGRVID